MKEFALKEYKYFKPFVNQLIDLFNEKRISEIFLPLKREYLTEIETLNQFSKNINNSIHQNIIEEHIVIYNRGKKIISTAPSTKL